MEPSQMTDEELEAAATPDQPEEPAKEEAPVDPPQKEEPEPKSETPEEAPAEEAPAEQEPEETPAAPSRREQLRVQSLLKKYGPPPAPSQETKPNFRDKVESDENGYQIMEDTAKQYADSRSDQVLAQAETKTWRKFLSLEDKQVRTQYPELDGDNQERFHPALADAMNRKYLRHVGWSPGDPSRGIPETVQFPDISYLDFVESEMEYADELASLKASTSTKNIAKQAASTGLRPDGSSARRLDLNKDPSQMTDEELKAAVDATLPTRDARGRFLTKS